MNYTIIDSDDYAASGIETMFFPAGEPHVKVPKFEGRVLFFAKCRTWNDTGFAALVVDALGRQSLRDLCVFVPYFPGARQDRSHGACGLTAAVVSNMFVGAWPMYTFDIHSETSRTLSGAANFDLVDLDFPIRPGVVGVIAPDKGATARARVFRDKFYPNTALLECLKARDPQTGALSHYLMPKLPKEGHYIVVDDICDGGGTFNMLADAFRGYVGPGAINYSLELVVSHGIFSKGLSAISPLYKDITTTDSWCRTNTALPNSVRAGERLTVLPLNQLFDTIVGEMN